jgi:hypothetical protein
MHSESWWTDVETFRAATAIDALAESKVTFTTHCPIGTDFMDRCHNDLHCFPYDTFYLGSDDVQWGAAHFNAYEGVNFGKHKFYEFDANGNPKPSPFGEPTSDGVGIVLNHCYITCPNVLEYQDKLVAWVEYIMGLGADGVFVDNLFARQPCFGARLGIHPHIFPNPPDPADPSAQNQAFTSLLHRVHQVVRKHKPDGRLLGNSGDPLNLPLEFQQYIASDTLEAYICQGVTPQNPTGRTKDWRSGPPAITWDSAGRLLQAYLARDKQILVISDLDTSSPYGVAEDAFLCYASARLAGFIWTCGIPDSYDANVRKLFSLRLGKPLTGELTDPTSGVNYRVFERGLVAVNPDTINDKILTPRPPIVGSIFVDVLAGASTNVLAVPKYSGRVFLFGASVDVGFGRVTA